MFSSYLESSVEGLHGVEVFGESLIVVWTHKHQVETIVRTAQRLITFSTYTFTWELFQYNIRLFMCHFHKIPYKVDTKGNTKANKKDFLHALVK